MSAPIHHEKPTGKLVFEKSEGWKYKSYNHIDAHHLNYSIDILLPGCDDFPSDLEQIVTEQPVFLAQQVPMGKLITEEFQCCFIKRGKVCALSYGTSVDSNDCVAILPTGTMVLHMTKDTYQELGLEGRLSVFGNEIRKYVVEINMAHSKFNPGQKFYERVKWCLTDRLNLKFDLLFTWEPPLSTICPTSVQDFFTANNIICNRVQLSKCVQHFKDLDVPRVCYIDPQNKSEENCGYLEMFEWLGACTVGADLKDLGADSFISSYTCPSPSEKIGPSVGIRYQGMFTSSTIRKAVQCLQSFREKKSKPWFSITVHGFADSPVTENQREHGFYNNGDNLYTYVLFPDGPWIYTALGGRDIYS